MKILVTVQRRNRRDFILTLRFGREAKQLPAGVTKRWGLLWREVSR
jgi:hypothetical protein